MSLQADISSFVRKTGLGLDIVLRKIAFDAFLGLLLRSPVDTGRFQANWRIGINKPDLTTDESTTTPDGSEINVAKWGDTIHMTNNLPYARPLEDGSSSQAPAGIVGPTFDAMKANVRAIAGQAVKFS